MWRYVGSALVFAICSPVVGDRLFEIPTGSIACRGALTVSFFSAVSNTDLQFQRLELAVHKHLDITLTGDGPLGRARRQTIDLHYNYFPPISERFPGVSFGIRDLADQTQRGFGWYAAFTYAVPMMNAAAWEKDFRIHFGFGGGGLPSVFAGFELPLTNNFTLWGEHDGRFISAGIEWWPLRNGSLLVFVSNDRIWCGFRLARLPGPPIVPPQDPNFGEAR